MSRSEPKRRPHAYGCGLIAALTLGLARGATAQELPAAPADLQGSDRLEIVSGYLPDHGPEAEVRGMVKRRRPGPVDGHLDVIAFDASGARIAERATRWRGTFGRHAPTLFYSVRLPAARSAVARIAVRWAPGAAELEGHGP